MQYEDRWFIEVDLDTESPSKIIDKCERYHKYYRSGLEQQEAGVFPLTVWIVSSVERKEKLISYIREAFDKQPKLFAVIMVAVPLERRRHDGKGKARTSNVLR